MNHKRMFLRRKRSPGSRNPSTKQQPPQQTNTTTEGDKHGSFFYERVNLFHRNDYREIGAILYLFLRIICCQFATVTFIRQTANPSQHGDGATAWRPSSGSDVHGGCGGVSSSGTDVHGGCGGASSSGSDVHGGCGGVSSSGCDVHGGGGGASGVPIADHHPAAAVGVHAQVSAGVCRLGDGAAAEEIAVIVATELLAEEIERERVDARVDEREAEGDDLEDVPEHVVLAAVVVEPHQIDVARQPADDEDKHKGEDYLGDLLARLQLFPRLLAVAASAAAAAGQVPRAEHEGAGHQGVEHRDDEHRDGEVDDEAEHDVQPPVVAAERRQPHAAHAHRAIRAVWLVADARQYRLGHGERDGQHPDGDGDGVGARAERDAMLTHREDDGAEAVAAERRQREDGDAERQRLEELVEAAHDDAEVPLGERVDGGGDRHRDEDEQHVADGQTDDEHVRRVAHVLVAHHAVDQRAVTDQADEENDGEHDRNGVRFRQVGEHTERVIGRRWIVEIQPRRAVRSEPVPRADTS